MKKITAGIIAVVLSTALITTGIKTTSKVMAEDTDNNSVETVSVNTSDL